MNKFLGNEQTFVHSPSRENPVLYIYIHKYIYAYTYIYIYIYIYKRTFAKRFLYTMKKLRVHHIHQVPKWPSYFCKI